MLAAVGTLTRRELDMLLAVARGGSNTDIARDLKLSTTTVKSHVHTVLRKLGCTARAQLVVLAYESGIVLPDSSGARVRWSEATPSIETSDLDSQPANSPPSPSPNAPGEDP